MRSRKVLWVSTVLTLAALAGSALLPSSPALADGKVMPPRDYTGSLEEKSQEAIIIFRGGTESKSAVEDLILKITVTGEPASGEELKSFGWVIPFPRAPKVAKEDQKLFEECFRYVESRRQSTRKKGKSLGGTAAGAERGVNVISRKVVGSYDVAVVRETERGALNRWLDAEGFQTLPDGEEVIAHYRRKGYVFACLKVNDAKLTRERSVVDLHPLRFTFETGGRDGIYFPMKMTGLQTKPFDVNLYVFYRAWLNDRINEYGYRHRGFSMRFRDWDSPKCKANAGKTWSDPQGDPYLAPFAGRIPTVTRLFQKLHPGARFYLTNIQANRLKPDDVRHWPEDLWLFPYYTDPDFVPYDARPGGPTAGVSGRE